MLTIIGLEKASPAAAKIIVPPSASTVPSLIISAGVCASASGDSKEPISTMTLLPGWPRNTLSPAVITTYPAGQFILPALVTCFPTRYTLLAEMSP